MVAVLDGLPVGTGFILPRYAGRELMARAAQDVSSSLALACPAHIEFLVSY